MPTPRRNPSSYPTEFFELLRRVSNDHSITITFETAEKASAFRKKLYAFRDSLEEAPEHNVELLFVARSMTVSVKDNTCTVSIPEMADLGEFE